MPYSDSQVSRRKPPIRRTVALLALALALSIGFTTSHRQPHCPIAVPTSPYLDRDWQQLTFYEPGPEGVTVPVGGSEFFHPVATIQTGITALTRGNTADAATAADALLANAEWRGDSMLLPYRFDIDWYGHHRMTDW